MRRLNSAEFAREYKTLTDPVLVMVGKRPIGVWTPDHARWPGYDPKATGKPSEHQVPATTGLRDVRFRLRRPDYLRWRPVSYPKADPNGR